MYMIKLGELKAILKNCELLYNKLKNAGISVNYGITVSDLNLDFVKENYKKFKYINLSCNFCSQRMAFTIKNLKWMIKD